MNFAVLIDLNSTRIDYDVFLNAMDELKRDYQASIVYTKFYSYNSKRHARFNAYVKKEGCDVALALQNRKKVKIDIRQVIDGVAIANSDKDIDGFFIVCSKVDSMPFLQAIKSRNKKLILGIENCSDTPEICDGGILLRIPLNDKADSLDEIEEKANDDNITNYQIETQMIACENAKELPFTNIKGSEKEMQAIQKGLSSLINEKLYGKQFLENTQELESLLKKYF